MASFPGSVKTFTTRNAGDTIQPSHINDLQDEVNAIEDGYRNASAPLNSSNSTLVSLTVSSGAVFMGGLTLSGRQSATLSTGDNHNLSVGSSVAVLLLTGNSSGSTLTGIATAGGAPRLLFINNASPADVGLKNNAGSASSNRFILPANSDLTLHAGDGVIVWYDTAFGFYRSFLA